LKAMANPQGAVLSRVRRLRDRMNYTQSTELRMRHLGALPLVAAALMGSASLPESSKAQSDPYALDRLFLESNEDTPLYEVLKFTSETQVANYYGKNSNEADLATEFYANGGTGEATMLFARLPVLPARAHLYGSNVDLTLPEMQAIHGTLAITSQGYNYSASINLAGVTSIGAGVKEIGEALNQNLPPAASTTGSSITPVSASFTGSINAGVLTVSSASPGSIQIGSFISGKGIPTGTNPNNQPQITAQLSGTAGGAGTYALFLREGYVPSETITEKYGLLTVGSTSSGQVKAGEQVSGAGILSHTAIEENLNPNGTGNQWVVDLSQNVASENMSMTGAPLELNYKRVKGATENSGHFMIQQWPTFNWESSSLTWMTGSAAGKLGMAQSDSGSPEGAFLSSTGQIVECVACPGSLSPGSPSQWMTDFVHDFSSDFYSFQTTYNPKKATPPGLEEALEAWAKSTGGEYTYLKGYSANTPPIIGSTGASLEQLSLTQGATVAAIPGAAVPEPSTWAMILISFAGLGFMSRPRLRAKYARAA
jgi:hypothetical protein